MKRSPPRLTRIARLTAVAGIVLLVVAAAGRWAYRHYTNPARLQRIAREFLEKATSCRVSIGSAALVQSDRIRFDDIRILADAGALKAHSTGDTEPEAPWITCARLELDFSPIQAVLGRLKVLAVGMDRPTLHLARLQADRPHGVWWGGRLGGRQPARPLPPVLLRQAEIVFGEPSSPGPDNVIRLDVSGNRDPNNRYGYVIDWKRDGPERATGRVRLDGAGGVVEDGGGGTPWLTCGQLLAVVRAVAANASATAQLEDLVQRYTLTGAARLADYRFDFSGGAAAAAAPAETDRHDSPEPSVQAATMAPSPIVSVIVEFRGAGFSIPVGDPEADRPAEERYLCFRELGGSVRCDPTGAGFHLAGSFHEARFDVAGRLSPDPAGGWREPAALGVRLDADVRGLLMPQRDPVAAPSPFRLIERVHALTKLYNDFDPSGPADLRFSMVKRPGAGETVDLPYLELAAQGGTATCRFFPYRAEDVRGTVEFTPLGVVVRDMHARHGGGAFVVNAWTSGTSRSHAARVHVAGTNISLDDDLRQAMPFNDQVVFDRFAPSGVADLRVILARPEADAPGVQCPWHTRVEADLRGVCAEYDAFPYPVTELTGKVVIDGGRFLLTRLEGTHDGASVVLDGAVLAPNGRVEDVDLTIWAAEAAVDGALCDALSRHRFGLVRDFQPTGTFDAICRLGFDPASRAVTYDVDVRPRALTIRHDRLPLPLTCTRGTLRIDAAGVALRDVGGRLGGDMELTLNGHHRTGGDAPGTAIDILTRSPSLDPRLAEGLAPFISGVMEAWQMDGAVTCRSTIARGADDPPGGYQVRHLLSLSGVRIARRDGPPAFEDVHAEVVIDDEGVAIGGATARLLGTDVQFDLHAAAGAEGGLRCQAAVRAEGLTLGPALTAILPQRARAVAAALAPAGRVDVHIDELRYLRDNEAAPGVWSVRGTALVRGLALQGGRDLRDADVSLSVEGQLCDARSGSVLQGRWSAARCTLFNHPLTEVAGEWSLAAAAGGPAHLAMRDLVGRLYGGDVVGDVELSGADGRTRYELETMIGGASVDRFFHSGVEAAAPAAEDGARDPGFTVASATPSPAAVRPAQPSTGSIQVRGMVEGRLHLTGEFGDALSRRGAGSVRITEAHMYRLPVLLAILNVFNLAVPDDNAFHEVEADFLVEGNRIRFDDIILHGKALALIGNGSLYLPGRQLDLYLATVSPHRWAKVPMLTEFLEAASREIIELHVTGTLSSPQVSPGPLRSLKGLIETLFQKRHRSAPDGQR